MTIPSTGSTLSYAGENVLEQAVRPAPPTAPSADAVTALKNGYTNLQQQDTAELLTVSLGTADQAATNVDSVLAQASALQAALDGRSRPTVPADLGNYSYKNDTSPYDVLNLPTIEAQISSSDAAAFAAIDNAVKHASPGTGFSFDSLA